MKSLSTEAELVIAELYRRYQRAGGDLSKTANPTVDVRTAELSTALRTSLSQEEVHDALEELAASQCLTRHGDGFYTLTPIGARRGRPPAAE